MAMATGTSEAKLTLSNDHYEEDTRMNLSGVKDWDSGMKPFFQYDQVEVWGGSVEIEFTLQEREGQWDGTHYTVK